MRSSDAQQREIPRFIYFTGVDGSGKSTYVAMLIKEFEKRGLKAKRVWLRFNYLFTKPILLYCRVTGLTRRLIRGGCKISVHDFYQSPTVGKLVQYLHFLDTCLHYFFRVYLPLRFTDQYILCDRFVYDILADFMIENRDFNLPGTVVAKRLLKLLPEDAKVLYFKVEKDEIIRRKPEVLNDDEDYDYKYNCYKTIEKCIDAEIIDNNKEQDGVYRKIVNRIFPQPHNHLLLKEDILCGTQ